MRCAPGHVRAGQTGQALVEYALLAGLVAVGLVSVSGWMLGALKSYHEEVVSFLFLPIP